MEPNGRKKSDGQKLFAEEKSRHFCLGAALYTAKSVRVLGLCCMEGTHI